MTDIGKTTTIKGESGAEYKFKLYTFDSFTEIEHYWTSVIPAVFLFTKRSPSNGAYYHSYLYVGETDDLSSHFIAFSKQLEIMLHQANCIGIYTLAGVAVKEERVRILHDILEARRFPCNG